MIAVVVVTYNSQRLLADLIDSLGPGLDGVDWHLTVADNDSADDSVAEVLRLKPDATVVEMGRNAGYAAGINAAVAKSGPYTAILVLNPDVRLTPGCIHPLLETLRKDGTGIAVPLLTDGDGELIETMRREPAIRRVLADAFLGAGRAGRIGTLGEMITDPARYGSETVADWAEGSTQLISADCWNAIAPWDESFFLYSEETDFALRARDAGFATRFTPVARAVHLEGDSKVSPGLWALLTINKVRLYGRRHHRLATTAFWAALLLRETSRAALGKAPSRRAVRFLLSPSRLRETPGPHTVHGRQA
ncbi:glycosyltransferase [Actinoplanes derwentensis]|uniref:Glycosyltransferase, GT2 family n=1 Tax=Actinoplanes derwentensis TaxID=113562 RepID=A0A1H2BCB9_9ACTN|nr:glycosyltransferase family 2 protein [Actinoplanes derwentensis]GID88632.1 glycosyl transferase [Actinoplanes derwentensis]SDT55883.1 Glycosyltransferase, GT2 family [Actinoplanes derwentensis]